MDLVLLNAANDRRLGLTAVADQQLGELGFRKSRIAGFTFK